MRIVSDLSILQAVEIVKAAVPSQSGAQTSYPENIAKLLEVVANKLEDLRNGPEKR